KRASPSGHRSGYSVHEAAAAYAPVADALSVLTDGPHFGGSVDDLRTARRKFVGPILAKDFIVDPAQVSEARAAGADAVLVMMSVLDDEGAARVMAVARRLRMDAIVEVHDEGELGRALALGAEIVGINNRDLKTLTTDLGVTERLAPLVPGSVTIIAESGIGGRPDVERLAPLADAFLVGSALMAAADIFEAARALVYGRVKLCGLTRVEDLLVAGRAGATHAGLILVHGTPRAVGIGEAASLASSARALGMKAVGVFRDAAPSDVAMAVDRLGLDAVQLHGKETREMIAEIRARLPGSVEIWALCGVGARAARPRNEADRTLFDTVRNGKSGGTGVSFDWSLVRARDDLSSAFLAGGIGPDNARTAAGIGAYGLDVGSSVEARPRIKDPAKVAALFAALRPACRAVA
ncbi:MAG TPA: bifunctional indole-3-glycerol-phosphate synthase TrpC/phosphoribosylanthranilate isomerase TrpF, partial [Sphingomicrobium sp.]|nr:bifunctional indole-3-glycerol-phosphate synthase TrpC/phosphoribosylanthranilate isomerase TrpF [Sphingomicrobium sp.]